MRIFAQCDSEGNILATVKVEVMAEELDHPFGNLEEESVVVQIEPNSELEAIECHEFDELYIVDIESQELKTKKEAQAVTKIKSIARSFDTELGIGLDLI